MKNYDKIYTFYFSHPKDYYQSINERKLFEKFTVPQLLDDFLSWKSSFLHEISYSFDNEDEHFAMIQFDLNQNLEFIILKNKSLEETYIALIIKMIIELILYVHNLNLFGIVFQLSNFSINSKGKLVLRNRFSLSSNIQKRIDDWFGFAYLVQKILPVDDNKDFFDSISRNFKEFLKYFENLQSNDIINNKNFDVDENLKQLLSTKFLSLKLNILNDLIDDYDLINDIEITSIVGFDIKKTKEIEILQKSGIPGNLSTDLFKFESYEDAISKQKKFIESFKTVFERYKDDKDLKKKQNIVNLLNTIEIQLQNMEKNTPLSGLKLIEAYLKNI